MKHGPPSMGFVCGRLTVTLPGKSRSRCSCLCGSYADVLNRNLALGLTKSCGCLGRVRVGVETVGDYRVLERKRVKKDQTRTYWLVECCYCGRKKWSFAGNIAKGLSVRCPCRIRALAEKNVASFWNAFVKTYQDGARSRGLEWALTIDQVYALAGQPCFYCGAPPSPRKSHWRSYCTVDVSGLDRKNNDFGYTSDNVVPCCAVCNTMKMEMSVESFVTQCQKISTRFSEASAS